MGLFEWGEKRFARGITKAMIRSYKLHKQYDSSLSDFELIKRTLADRLGEPAKTLLADMDDDNFWNNVAGKSFIEIIYLLVRMEYVEYMKGTLDSEDPKTNIVFKNTILDEIKHLDI